MLMLGCFCDGGFVGLFLVELVVSLVLFITLWGVLDLRGLIATY